MAQAPTLNQKKKPNQTQNVKVVVRVRPLNQDEIDRRMKSTLQCISHREIRSKDKTYSFDRVFKPDCAQIDIYSHVIGPMIQDVIMGYDCTVFAYGQTGTGKTHTMIGGQRSAESNLNWKEDEEAGFIPRAAANIFHELGLMHITEYNVRVSFLELYNEDVRDLLNDLEVSPPLNLYMDPKGRIYIQHLSENTVCNSNDIYMLLQKGTLKRQTAATLLNTHSSRSHTVFTITVFTRETSVNGEEILKTGKLNLVDLAGSENIAKSGAKDKRAQESANINRSLLTLGRVIQNLADNSKYVPYRDSKLTRILRDSLGGHTKTCIVATVSPAQVAYDETQNTLEYALRAKDIRNTPMMNEKITKAEMMNQLNLEMEKLKKDIEELKKDLEAARTGNGFYVPKDSWETMQAKSKMHAGVMAVKNGIIQDLKKKLDELEIMRNLKEKEFEDVMRECKKKDDFINKVKTAFKKQNAVLKQEQYVASYYSATLEETNLEGKVLLETTNKLLTDQQILQRKLENQYTNNYSKQSMLKEKGLLQESHKNAAIDTLTMLKSNVTASISQIQNDIVLSKQTWHEHVHLVNGTRDNTQQSVQGVQNIRNEVHDSCAEAGCVANSMQGHIAEAIAEVDTYSKETHNLQGQINQFNECLQGEFDTQIANFFIDLIAKLKHRKEDKKLLLNDLQRFSSVTKNDIENLESTISSLTNLKSSICENFHSKLATHQEQVKQKLGVVDKTKLTIDNSLKGANQSLESLKRKITEIETSFLHSLSENNERVFEGMKDIHNSLNLVSSTCSKVSRTVDEQVADCEKHLASVDALRKDIENLSVPLPRAGDTPQSKLVTYPKRLGRQALPKHELIKKFKEEYGEDLENQSCNLNVSSDSFVQLEDSENE
ncbi:kinesin-like protein KIF11 isoform X1 [Euwallacea similis]|uniref:kinesin-like protein KIF11 isoform X1 n=1 Tax=Euwallacea similis TaxID=1736056 RepID=UPI003450B7CA